MMTQNAAAMSDAEIDAQLQALKRAHEEDSAGPQNALDRGIVSVGSAFCSQSRQSFHFMKLLPAISSMHRRSGRMKLSSPLLRPVIYTAACNALPQTNTFALA
jgi:hypothetical protein